MKKKAITGGARHANVSIPQSTASASFAGTPLPSLFRSRSRNQIRDHSSRLADLLFLFQSSTWAIRQALEGYYSRICCCFDYIDNLTVKGMHTSQRSQWADCCQHEQEISILQQKLIEVHNKLIDQLDICKEQELTIIELTKQLQTQPRHSVHSFETFNYQSFGQHSEQQENRIPNYYHSPSHDSRQSQQAKAQLLQADLEAMRNKVLAEITEKNKLKEETKEMKTKYKRELGTQLKKNEQLQNQMQKLQEDYELLKIKYEKIKKAPKAEADVDKLAQLLVETEAKYFKEKDINRELHNRIKTMENSNPHEELRPALRPTQLNLQERIHTPKPERTPVTEKKNRVEREPQRYPEGVERSESQNKRKSFEETRDLIKKLEETESYMRRNRRPVV